MQRYTGHSLLLVLGAMFVFHSPFTRWWAEQDLPWYTVFLLWLGLIALVALDHFVTRKNRKSAKDKDRPDGD